MRKLPEDCEEERSLNCIENKLRAVFDLVITNGMEAVNWEYFASTTLREILFQEIPFIRSGIFKNSFPKRSKQGKDEG